MMSTAVQQCVFENKKNMTASKPSNQSNGLGGTIGCKGSPMYLVVSQAQQYNMKQTRNNVYVNLP